MANLKLRVKKVRIFKKDWNLTLLQDLCQISVQPERDLGQERQF